MCFIDFIYSVDFHLVATARRKVAPQRRKEGRKEGRKEKREGGRKEGSAHRKGNIFNNK